MTWVQNNSPKRSSSNEPMYIRNSTPNNKIKKRRLFSKLHFSFYDGLQVNERHFSHTCSATHALWFITLSLSSFHNQTYISNGRERVPPVSRPDESVFSRRKKIAFLWVSFRVTIVKFESGNFIKNTKKSYKAGKVAQRWEKWHSFMVLKKSMVVKNVANRDLSCTRVTLVFFIWGVCSVAD